MVTLEREDEITGPVIAPFFPQVSTSSNFKICGGKINTFMSLPLACQKHIVFGYVQMCIYP